ncbi:rust resistance kinase Lr10-like [Magnolia sinica]|uniref:rust resistance kinase Lr10-like n=1 Tax=Magnolia sinica TaxID=86752 RepID=UPI00265AB647|nr:rust resistance kinase Lr10-like [Magnolia sinica]
MKPSHRLSNLLLFFHLISTFLQVGHTSNISSFYYDQCSPSTCGKSILKFPLGRNAPCRSAYITTSCENGTVFITDDENPHIKYKVAEDLTDEVYSNRMVKFVDVSLFGCGPIPPFKGSTANAGFESQKWLVEGVFHAKSDYWLGTFFNCTKKPAEDIVSRLREGPCLECGETSNLCYFYDGYMSDIPNCRPFRTIIPVKVFNNFSMVGNLRKVLQEGFRTDWDGVCGPCMEMGGGRCGYLDEKRRSGKEVCFCNSGVHRHNCSDGLIIEPVAEGGGPKRRDPKRRMMLIIGFLLVLVTVVACAIYIYCLQRRRMKRRSQQRGQDEQVLRRYLNNDNSTPASIETFLHNYNSGMPTRFSYKQLKKYSHNFTHKLGQGGFGSVYKADLPNGLVVAVKLLDETEQSEAQFVNEVQTIGRIHHNHLVRLLGFCFDKSRRALVYEFMANGSLDKYIYQSDDGLPDKLGWAQLHEIAVGTARGIAYLHDECRVRILHCDIKPHNILLDERFTPKVSDFGLAQALNRETSHVSLPRGRGTPGYAPPEMWLMNHGPVTSKSDVYSYGMVILEMVGKRRNFNEEASSESEAYFPEWAYLHYVVEVGGEWSKHNSDQGREDDEIVRTMSLVGLWCIQFEPNLRPTMCRVIEMLEGNVVIDAPPVPFDVSVSRVVTGGTRMIPIKDCIVHH